MQIKGGIIKDVSGKAQKIVGKENELEAANKACEKFLSDCAIKQIKNSIWCSDKNFNKTKFEPFMTKVLGGDNIELSEADLTRFQKEAATQQKLDELSFLDKGICSDEFTQLLSALVSSIKKAASREAIPSLKSTPALEAWLKEGVREHIHSDEPCPVCKNAISEERIKELKGHFSTEAEELEKELNVQKEKLDSLLEALSETPIKEKMHTAYYDENIWSSFTKARKEVISLYADITSLISEKLKSVDVSLTIDFSINEKSKIYSNFLNAIDEVNNKISEHNQYSSQQESIRIIAEQKLIQNIAVLNSLEYNELKVKAERIEKELIPLNKLFEEIPVKIQTLENQLTEIGKSSERINEFLKSYLGHDRLQLAVDEGGYAIIRNGKKSSAPLSEGEKTALAFCYFIASIQKDANCDLKNTILVIDDPVSSLDNRHLHYVFSFMKRMTVEASQLFILTHNFSFYKECQKNIASNKDKEEGRLNLLSIQLKNDQNGYYSSLELIPEALRIHESEYHYFSSKLFTANDNGWDSPDLYGLANACRRVLECFFSFKLPKEAGLSNKFEELIGVIEDGYKGADQMPKIVASAKERFVQIASHSDNLDKLLGLDNVTLDSVKDAVQFTLEFIEHADAVHFKALKKSAK